MCLAVPSRVVSVDGFDAVVEAAGESRRVSLMLLDEAVCAGDYLLIRNGLFAYERLDREQALQALRLIDDVVAASGGADVKSW